jgi:hypothetical protein
MREKEEIWLGTKFSIDIIGRFEGIKSKVAM